MNEFNIFASSLLSLFLLVILIFWLYRDYQIDSYRQKMFVLRDRLFDEARRGNLPFESDAYGMLRSTINGSIRFAHKLSLIQFILFMGLLKSDQEHLGKSFGKRLEEKVKDFTAEQSELVKKYHQEMNFLLLEHILLSSPLILLTIIVPFVLIFKAKEVISSGLKLLQSPIDRLDSAALSIGSK